jgi:hypothetical protein
MTDMNLRNYGSARSLQHLAPAREVWSLSIALAAQTSLHIEEIYPHLYSSFSLSVVPEIFMVSLGIFYIIEFMSSVSGHCCTSSMPPDSPWFWVCGCPIFALSVGFIQGLGCDINLLPPLAEIRGIALTCVAELCLGIYPISSYFPPRCSTFTHLTCTCLLGDIPW